MTKTCRHKIHTKILEFRFCSRKPDKDGYCTRHHPDYISPKDLAALEEYDPDLAKQIRGKS